LIYKNIAFKSQHRSDQKNWDAKYIMAHNSHVKFLEVLEIPHFGWISNIFMFDVLGESTDATTQFSVCSRLLEQFFMTSFAGFGREVKKPNFGGKAACAKFWCIRLEFNYHNLYLKLLRNKASCLIST